MPHFTASSVNSKPPKHERATYAAKISFFGPAFRGWAWTPGLPGTAQGALQDAITRMIGNHEEDKQVTSFKQTILVLRSTTLSAFACVPLPWVCYDPCACGTGGCERCWAHRQGCECLWASHLLLFLGRIVPGRYCQLYQCCQPWPSESSARAACSPLFPCYFQGNPYDASSEQVVTLCRHTANVTQSCNRGLICAFLS